MGGGQCRWQVSALFTEHVSAHFNIASSSCMLYWRAESRVTCVVDSVRLVACCEAICLLHRQQLLMVRAAVVRVSCAVL